VTTGSQTGFTTGFTRFTRFGAVVVGLNFGQSKEKGAMSDDELTEKIIACAFRVHNALGPGFSEKVYENSMRVALNHERIRSGAKLQFRSTSKEKLSESFFPICGSKIESW